MAPLPIPRLYPIADAASFAAAPDPALALLEFAEELLAGGATLLQYRNKSGDARRMLADARELQRLCAGRARFILNDRADLCLAAEADGVHVGQDDLSPEAVRRIIGPARWLGVSTHNPAQLRDADLSPADYLAVGPVFATGTKLDPDPVIGLEGVRAARALTRKPLVAIGGITPENARSVLQAGADAVAVISALVREPRAVTQDFLRILADLR